MKKVLIAAFVICSFAFGYQTGKSLTVSASQEQWEYVFQSMNNVKGVVNKSNLPHQEVVYVVNAVDSFQSLAYPQLFKQLTDTSKAKK